MPRLLLPVLCVVVLLTSASCGGGGTRHSGDRVEVVFWHSMGGLNGDALQKMIDGFNASQDEYQVRAIFQGGFVESLKKFVSSFGTDSMPAMIQLDDIQLRFMVDSEATVAPERFIERDAAAADPSSLQIDLADIEPRAIDYYTLDGALRAMPFNLSGPVLYYDRSAFEEAGLDADRPPATLDEVRAYSERLLARDAEGAITRNGIALNISPWYFEQMMAKQGALYANNGNGREALATEVTFNGPQGEEILDWWGGMVEDGLATNVGRQGLQALLAVFTGKSAMAIESTAVMRSVLATLGAGAARFGAAPLPAPEGEGGGIVLGGAAVWITRDRPQEEQLGAWAFLKYATQPQVQAQWHFDTGYFPVSTTAWDLEPAATLHRDFPQFSAARQQVLDSPRNTVTAGAVIGPFTQVREGVSEAFERVLVGGETASEALERAAEEADRAIERYNRSVR